MLGSLIYIPPKGTVYLYLVRPKNALTMMLSHRLLLSLYLITAMGFVATVGFEPYPIDFLIKALPIGVLLVFAAHYLEGRTRTLTVAALVFSAGGDVMLALAFPNQFIFGLASFLIAQLMYVFVFLRFRNKEHFTQKLVLAGLVVIYAIVIGGVVMPEQAELKIAVSSYLVVIGCMVLAALFAWKRSYLHLIGALIFMVSDSIIAWNKFHAPVPFASVAIMATYYLAQYLIVIGIYRLSQERRSVATV